MILNLTTPYTMEETLLKMLFCHYRNPPNIFSNGFPIMKCKIFMENVPDELAEMQVEEFLIKSTNCEKLLGIKIDSKFSSGKNI